MPKNYEKITLTTCTRLTLKVISFAVAVLRDIDPKERLRRQKWLACDTSSLLRHYLSTVTRWNRLQSLN